MARAQTPAGARSATTAPKKPVEVVEPQAQEQQAFQQTNQYQYNTANSRMPMAIRQLNNAFMPISTLSISAKEYLENLRKGLMNYTLYNFEVIELPTANVSAAVVHEKSSNRGILLLFSEGFIDPTENPNSRTTRVFNKYVDTVSRRDGVNKDDITLITSIVISPDEYEFEYCGRMTNCIINSYIGADFNRNNEFTIQAYANVDGNSNSRFKIITNKAIVDDYIKRVSPHKVMSRNDIGFVVMADINPNQIPDAASVDKYLFAVTGYTKFVPPLPNSVIRKVLPVPTITDIISAKPLAGHVPLAITLAGMTFCAAQRWLVPYQNFGKDRPNLGYYIDDLQNAPVTDSAQLMALLNNYFLPPQLAIEISEGRYNLPGINAFVNIENMFAEFAKFFEKSEDYPEAFGGVRTPEYLNLVQQKFTQHKSYAQVTGTVVDQTGNKVDSRYIDFLALAAHFDDLNSIKNFIYEPMDPLERLRAIQEHYPQAQALYNTSTIVFSAAMMNYIEAGFAQNRTAFEPDFGGFQTQFFTSNDFNQANIVTDWNNMSNNIRYRPGVTNPYTGRSPYSR